LGGPTRLQAAWLVVVRVEDVDREPWLLLTDWPVINAASAASVVTYGRASSVALALAWFDEHEGLLPPLLELPAAA